jgi:hypothetical protein
MTNRNALQLREQALALLRIEQEQRSEQLDLASGDTKDPAATQGQIAMSETRRPSSPGRLTTIRRTAC